MRKNRQTSKDRIVTPSPEIKSGRRNGSRRSPKVSALFGTQPSGQQRTPTTRKASDSPKKKLAARRNRLIDFMRVAERRYIRPAGNLRRWWAADGSIGFKLSLFFADTPAYAAYDESPNADMPVRVLFTDESMEAALNFICMSPGFAEAVGSLKVPDGTLKSRCATDSPAWLLEYCGEEEGKTLEAARADKMLDTPSPIHPLLVLISDTATVVVVDHADTSSDSFLLARDAERRTRIDHINQTRTGTTFSRDAPEIKQWLAIREQEALKIDPETADVCWDYTYIFDEYGLNLDVPEGFAAFGKTYFARSQGSTTWVSFSHLPEATRQRLWEKQSRLVYIPPELKVDDVPWEEE